MLWISFPKVEKGFSTPPPIGPHKLISTWSSHLSPTPPSPVFIREAPSTSRFRHEVATLALYLLLQFLSKKYTTSANGFLWIQILFRVLLPTIYQGVSFFRCTGIRNAAVLNVIFLWELQCCHAVCFALSQWFGEGEVWRYF
ncbi:hypothetical protein CEXT_585181 [Caerostris extrusa]|uniref:Uncharacterized protein n=1 Tax=Caerostris extrusa TaxID=172846 RepID=A0AAV4QIW0_CAEEX|nr:hypothetical protein CEXT_585181 [Caerostris extrusa]